MTMSWPCHWSADCAAARVERRTTATSGRTVVSTYHAGSDRVGLLRLGPRCGDHRDPDTVDRLDLEREAQELPAAPVPTRGALA